MAYTTIDDPSEYFHTQLYTGTGSTNAITNDANAGNFKPDWLWIKQRNTTRSHRLITSSFSSTYLQSNLSDAEASNDVVNSLDTDGFTLSSPASVNQSSGTYVAWQWKANGGTTSSNTDGSITSTVQANTTAGFSIVTYTGTGSNATVGHGLGTTPQMYWVKRRSSDEHWQIYSEVFGGTHTFQMSAPGDPAQDRDNRFNDTAPTSSVFSLGSHASTNGSSDTYVAYCFANIKGYSKFGSYEGNGNADGPFVYTGFKPAWVWVKNADTSSTSYNMLDSTRDTSNPLSSYINADENNAEASFNIYDFLSNGFKSINGGSTFNKSGDTHIYMAFAEHPFVSSKGVPVTAR